MYTYVLTFDLLNTTIYMYDIANIEWLDVLQANNPDIVYDLFIIKIKTIYERCFPLSTVKIKCKTKHKPWITQALIVSCKRKNKLYKQWLLNKSL